MGVNSYVNERGETLWHVYVNLRSKIRSKDIRVQKHVYEIKTESAANSLEKKLLTELSREVQRRELIGTLWEDVIERWEESVKKLPENDEDFLQPDTVSDMVTMLKTYTKSWLDRPANELNQGDGKSALKEAREAGRSRSFEVKLKSAIQTIYAWGIQERVISGAHQTPVVGVKVRGILEEKLPEILTIEQIRSLLVRGRGLAHDWLSIWTVALLTGMRNGELHALRWAKVELVSDAQAEHQLSLPMDKRNFGFIRVHVSFSAKRGIEKCTKGRYWRTVPISSELFRVLKELKAITGGQEFVLPRFRDWNKGEQARVLRTFCESVSLPSIKFHTLRACFATQLLQNGVAPGRVMKVCGWKDFKTMARYIRMAGIEERGVTESLRVLSSDEEVFNKVVDIYQYRHLPQAEVSECPALANCG